MEITLALATNQAMMQTSPAPIKAGTRVITLGTLAGPPPRAYRAQSSNLLIVNDTFYVVDAGDGVTRRLAKAGMNIRNIGTIFITHHHGDHTAGLRTLISVGGRQGGTAPVNVYCPPRAARLGQATRQYFSLSSGN